MFLPVESHGWRALVGSNMTKQLAPIFFWPNVYLDLPILLLLLLLFDTEVHELLVYFAE